MARNTLAGTKVGKGKTAKFYQANPDAKKKKAEYDTAYNAKPSRKRYRALLQAINRENGTHGNHDGKDVAHTSKTKTISQDQSKNRADKKRKFFK